MNLTYWGVWEDDVSPPRLHVAQQEEGRKEWPMWHERKTTCPCQPSVSTEMTLNGLLGQIVVHHERVQ